MKRTMAVMLLCLLLGCAEKSKNTSAAFSESKEKNHFVYQDQPVQNNHIDTMQIREAHFRIDENGVITKYSGPHNVPLVIPPSIRGVPVTAINGISSINSFSGVFRNMELTSVAIPDTVSYIGSTTFSNNKLTSVAIPGSVSYIGEAAFSGNQLSSVVIPGSVSYIGNSAFTFNQLTSVVIPGSITEIRPDTFSNNRLTSVVIPDSVTIIYPDAFKDNPITSITIGANVELFEYSYTETASYAGLEYITVAFTVFDNNFSDFYNDNGKQAGAYVFNDGQWSME
ncbi:MAG: leucine-rich repeat domain-containing protein [Treponema sp.]|jgi:hypothetical protein|nr:leucine-rich repeat domain-containing protein [Treponema sp.]